MRNTAAVVLDNMHSYLTEQELKVGEIKVIFLQSNVTSSVSLWTKMSVKHKTEYQHRLFQSSTTITEARVMIENLKQVNIKVVVYWTA